MTHLNLGKKKKLHKNFNKSTGKRKKVAKKKRS